MINIKDLPIGEPIYTYASEDGSNIHIAAERLRIWCQRTKPEIFLAPVDEQLAETFIRDNLISTERLFSLTLQILQDGQLEPVIFCKTGTTSHGGDDVILADGHHRYYLQRKAGHLLAHILEKHEWEPFRIDGHPTITQEQLINIPIHKREYWG